MELKKKKAELIAIFRYGLIASALHQSILERKRYFRSLEEKEFEVPHYGIKKYKSQTLKNWLNRYQNGGLDNLAPLVRKDAGLSKKIIGKVTEIIKKIIRDFPYLSASGIYRMLKREGHISSGAFSENTLRYYIKKNNMQEINTTKEPRKKFEKENVNELWVSDFMVGPYIKVGNKKIRVYLCAIIDDHSRVITGAGWFSRENCIALAMVLKQAVAVYGLPYVFYCDNGKVFSTNYLHLVCARLGIALVHSKPYDSPSRGKIERFFRTVRDKFLSSTNTEKLNSIEQLNELFTQWLDAEYHKQIHSGIEERPIDRYLNNSAKIKIRQVPEHELDSFFLNTITRKVKNDSTISVDNKLYEVPVEFIGKTVQLGFPIDKPENISIYDEKGKPICLIREVNLSENATKPYTGIHFKNIEKDKVIEKKDDKPEEKKND